MPPTRAPEPTRTCFDPFNSSSTGHQCAENRLSGSTSWRESRARKLAHQLSDSSGGGGVEHLCDLVDAGKEDLGKDGRKKNGYWEVGASALREKGWQDIRGLMGGNKKRKTEELFKDFNGYCKRQKASPMDKIDDPITRSLPVPSQASIVPPSQIPGPRVYTLSNSTTGATPTEPQIFRSLTLYLNGSTYASGISDHKLKSLFVQHGGSLSIALGRRTVTHVVLGSIVGGLAAGKIQKEVTKVGGKGVKYVTAQWVVDSVQCGKRLPESGYRAVHIAMKGQGSVLDKMGCKTEKVDEDKKGS
ncbi:hypothetical protein GJ744_001189 [Endocarpon pusillum]|uniref:BRCT domain-containing protein n=1 Tax=Endocarpon pusillum TaxID=364733 RepID=A0A8H7ABZ2_9EURO|nr:hypothetical protein GJ744_001189 [Endocarpon pusillum]